MSLCRYVFFVMIRRPPRYTRLTHSCPTRRSSYLARRQSGDWLCSRASKARQFFAGEYAAGRQIELHGVQRRFFGEDLVMQVRPGRETRGAHIADDLSLLHSVAGLQLLGIAAQMGIDRKSKRLNSSPYCATRMPSYA